MKNDKEPEYLDAKNLMPQIKSTLDREFLNFQFVLDRSPTSFLDLLTHKSYISCGLILLTAPCLSFCIINTHKDELEKSLR